VEGGLLLQSWSSTYTQYNLPRSTDFTPLPSVVRLPVTTARVYLLYGLRDI
jgi:hypothetical protein